MKFNGTKYFQIGPVGHITFVKCVKYHFLISPKAMFILYMGFGAVSYTHLDVYKRQGYPKHKVFS